MAWQILRKSCWLRRCPFYAGLFDEFWEWAVEIRRDLLEEHLRANWIWLVQYNIPPVLHRSWWDSSNSRLLWLCSSILLLTFPHETIFREYWSSLIRAGSHCRPNHSQILLLISDSTQHLRYSPGCPDPNESTSSPEETLPRLSAHHLQLIQAKYHILPP